MNQVNQRSGPRMALLIALLAAAAAVTMVIATGLGPVSVPPSTTFRILLSRLVELPPTWETLEENIVLGLRLPRVCLGMIVGASLAVCGVTMQALVRNSLADPFILGVSNGAAAFATLGMLFGAFSFLGTYALSISAFIGSAVTILFVYLISPRPGADQHHPAAALRCGGVHDHGRASPASSSSAPPTPWACTTRSSGCPAAWPGPSGPI